jgi:crotonobetainyl-CoA:carnitine CoA-transferase CaiB-like acyl-CoA transferase
MTRPFEGIRIIDVTHVLAGPFAAYQLAVLGAEVIKVEHPDEPDQTRDSGTDRELNRRGMGTSYLTQSSNKRSITLDLKTEAGRDILKRLVQRADIMVENYRPGAFAALGLGYDMVSEINPRLIYCSISAFGQDGPRGNQTAYDHVIQATSGLMATTGTAEVNPIKFGSPAVDYATGTMGAFALASALFQRERTGLGQRIDLAMLDVAMILMSSHLTGYLRNGAEPKPSGNRHLHATNSCYAAGDGLVMLGASNLRQQRRLWQALERPEMAKRTNEEREHDRDREAAVLTDILKTRTADEWASCPGGARAYPRRGRRRPAICRARRHPSSPVCRRGQRGFRRAVGGVQIRPWRREHRDAAARTGRRHRQRARRARLRHRPDRGLSPDKSDLRRPQAVPRCRSGNQN